LDRLACQLYIASTAAVPNLDLAVAANDGWLMGKVALAAAGHLDHGDGDLALYRGELATARFYGEQILPLAAAKASNVIAGDAALIGVGDELFQ
jgi:3-(methylthio)propanoyl-CoA dehydrogenase